MMTSLWKKSINIAAAVILASVILISTVPYEEHHSLRFAAEGGVGEECIEYEEEQRFVPKCCPDHKQHRDTSKHGTTR